MRSYLNFVAALASLAGIAIGPTLMAADVITTYPYPVPTGGSYASSGSSSSVAASASNAIIVALNARALMLKEMVQEHQSRAAELTQKNQNAKAQWETELVNELQEKNARVQKSIDQMSRPATASEALRVSGANTDDELLFISTVEARLAQVRDDLAAAIAESRNLSIQIATNKAPETIAAISSLVGDNQRLVNELQREQLDLELRKLEFRAIRKALQK